MDVAQLERVRYSRPPTPAEIKFGHGCRHYIDVAAEKCQKDSCGLKKWIVAEDGLRYCLSQR